MKACPQGGYEREERVKKSVASATKKMLLERDLFDLCRKILCHEKFDYWCAITGEFQERVYRLDRFYETNGSLVWERERPLWENLYGLRLSLQLDCHEIFDNAFLGLKRYALFERQLRSFEVLDVANFRDVASHKSVDVAFSRELSIFLSSVLKDKNKVNQFFRAFDTANEMIEDVWDMAEDTSDWNLNLWLTPIRQGCSREGAIAKNLDVLQELAAEAEAVYSVMEDGDRQILAAYYRKLLKMVVILKTRSGELQMRMKALPLIRYCNLER